jgi:hypothetical protein
MVQSKLLVHCRYGFLVGIFTQEDLRRVAGNEADEAEYDD